MIPTLKPGGVLLLEDYDFSSATVHPANELFERVTEAIVTLMSGVGFDPFLGRELIAEMTSCGLEAVEAEGRARLFRGGSEESDDEIEGPLRQLEGEANTFVSPILVSAWGRRLG
jgi:hypothetical protein